MFHRRRLNSIQYVLLGVLFGSSVYLWTRKASNVNRQQTVSNDLPQSVEEITTAGRQQDVTFNVDNDNGISPMADPLLAVNPCGEVTDQVPVVKAPVGIEPFPEFKYESIGKDDLNQTLDWLDLWNGDLNCTQHQVHLLKPGSQPQPGALVSFPGSGNSWLRMLLMGISGVFITSIYIGEDAAFQSKANSSYQVPIDCGCTMLQKTHDFSLDADLYNLLDSNRTYTLDKFKSKGILIIRNPFEAIHSYRNFAFTGMTGAAPETAFTGTSWDDFVGRSIAGWEVLALVWIRGLKQGGIIYYERLQRETKPELERLTKMLGLTYDEKRLNCVLQHTEDNSFKRDKKKKIADPYTSSQRLLIHKSIDVVQEALKKRGLDPLPTKYYDFYGFIPEYGVPD